MPWHDIDICEEDISIGDLVDYYDSNMYVPGSGRGIVLRTEQYQIPDSDSAPYTAVDAYIRTTALADHDINRPASKVSLTYYLVYRFKDANTGWYESCKLNLISKATKTGR